MQCYNNTEPDTHMAKNKKDFRRFSSAGIAMDKILNITNMAMTSSGFDVMYRHTQHNRYMYNDGKEILYNT